MHEERKPPYVMIGLTIIISVVVYFQLQKRNQATQRAIEEVENFTPARDGKLLPQAKTDRAKEVQRSMYKDPALALKLARQIADAPQNDEEAAFAGEKIPGILNLMFHKAIKAEDFEGALALLEELQADYPDHFQARSADSSWGSNLRDRLYVAMKAGEDERIERLLQALANGGYLTSQARLLEDYQEYQMDIWEAARAAGDEDEGERRLMLAARVLHTSAPFSHVVKTLLDKKEEAGEKWKDRADTLYQEGELIAALQFYQVALQKARNRAPAYFGEGDKTDWEAMQSIQADLEERVFEVVLEIGDKVQAGSSGLLSSDIINALEPEDFYRDAIRNAGNNLKLAAEPYKRIMAIQISELENLMDGIYQYDVITMPRDDTMEYEEKNAFYSLAYDVRNAANKVLEKTAPLVFQAMLADETYTPWPFISADVIAEIEKKEGDANQEERRRRALLQIARKRPKIIPLPELEEVREHLYEMLGRWGILYFEGTPGEGFSMLRRAIRGTQNAELRRDILLALQAMFVEAYRKKDFDALYELSGFYISEAEFNHAGEKFRQVFREAISQAAEQYRETSEMRRIFMLSILASAFPNEEIGQQAEKEAADLAFKIVGSRATEEKDTGVPNASGVEGHSVLAIDNSTEYHLLCFYRGPEDFFVNATPYRRGSIIAKNGTYNVAVITPSGDIVPYHGKMTLESNLVNSNYYIDSSSSSGSQYTFSGSSAHGEYSLMRAPQGLSDISIDPRTGAVAE